MGLHTGRSSQTAGDGTADSGQQASPFAADRGPAAVHSGQRPDRAPRAGSPPPAGEPPQRSPHHDRQAEDERPRDRPLHRPAAERDVAGQAPHLDGQGCAHLCEHHRPRHPPDDRQWRARHRPPRGAGRLH